MYSTHPIAVLVINLIVFPPEALASIKLQQSYIAQIRSRYQSMSADAAALERLFTSSQVKAEWFAPGFLAQVPIDKVREIIAGLKSEFGNYQKVQQNGQDYLVVLSRNSIPTKIVLNQKGQIVGLLFQPPSVKSLEEALTQLKSLPGQVSFLVKEGKSKLAELNSTTPLAVGSAFKLAVLKELQSQITSGKFSWKDVVLLQPEWKSLPSGMLQAWADKSPITIQTLATLMISLSDNTATDALIDLIGRAAVESIAPRNRPFLTTREFFILKGSQNKDLLERYRNSNEGQRRAILAELKQLPLPEVSEFIGNSPIALDVEWLFTTEELCTLMSEVAPLPVMSVNPGVANINDWERVAFKGGSESGVINMTTWLEAKNGKNYCVAATWNNSNEPVDETKFSTIYSGVLSFLASKM
ncbi:MAG: serine hydrolase [Scytonema sp. PMC 1069.18]|nr:serine hydrolase [Scytonema sp. PMC 1069.18]MEC4885778.1 serine hydrolase [Scytonema sp. PMC 1070.18]